MSDSPLLWNEIAGSYDRTRTFGGDPETQIPRDAARLLLARGAQRVLDLGCGTGRFAIPFAAEGLRVVAADRSPEMLARLVAKPPARAIHVVRCDAHALPFGRVFDAVFFSHFIHHVPSVERLADALAPVLVPGALVVDADTTHLERPAIQHVNERVFPLLVDGWKLWPKGERSLDRDLMDRLAARLGGAPSEVVPGREWTVAHSLRDALTEVRARTWSTIRVHPEARVLAAADAAERALVAEGRDLDARLDGREGVRFLIARLPG